MSFRVLGTGSYVPPKAVTNDELSQILDTSDEWIRQRVGVKERRFSVNETAAEMAAKAAQAAIENSGVEPSELLEKMACTGLERRVANGDILYHNNEEIYFSRLKYELSV